MRSRHCLVAILTSVSFFVSALALATPLHEAAKKNAIDEAERLIAQGAEVNAKDKDGSTPLHGAARGGHTAIAAQLIKNGAELDVKDKRGRTALHYAAFLGQGNHRVTKELIRKGADVNAKDKDGATPLNKALLGCQRTVELLKHNGAKGRVRR